MIRRLVLSKAARSDLNAIWRHSADAYGAEQANRYQKLINQALDDIRQSPERPTSTPRPEYGVKMRSYRIELSRERSGTGIKSPRHVIFYTLQYAEETHVVRILHERMDPGLHLDEGRR